MSSEQKPDESNSANSPFRGAGGRQEGGRSGKKSFVLRIDEGTYKALEKWAADEFRSVNGQMEWLLDHALKAAGRAKAAKRKADDGGKKEE